MKKYFKEHAGTILVLIVFFSLISLARTYGKEGGVMDQQFGNVFKVVSEQSGLPGAANPGQTNPEAGEE